MVELNQGELDLAVAELQASITRIDDIINSIPVGGVPPTHIDPLKVQLEGVNTALKSTNDRLLALGTVPDVPPEADPAAADNDDDLGV